MIAVRQRADAVRIPEVQGADENAQPWALPWDARAAVVGRAVAPAKRTGQSDGQQESIVESVDLEATVRGAVTRLLDVPEDRLTVQTPLLELGIDEETGLDVLVIVEDALDVRFPDDFLEGLHTYGDLTSAVRRAIGG
jgi:acyl carrier protein